MSSQRNPRTSIRIRVALSLGLIIIAVAVVLAYAAGHIARRQIEEERGQVLQASARRAMDSLDQGMFERYREIQILAQLSDLRDLTMPVERRRALLEEVQQTHGHHAWIGFAGLDGVAQVGTHGYLEGRDVSKRPWFKSGLAEPYVGDVHDALLLAKLLPNPSGGMVYLLDVAAPVRAADGTPIGVLCSHLHWRWTSDMLKSVVPDSSGIQAYLLSRNGLVLDGPGFNIFDRFEGVAPTVEQALHDRPAGFYLAHWKSDATYLTAHVTSTGFQSYPGLGWRLVLRQDTRAAFASALALQREIMGVGLLLGGLFALAGWWLAGRMTRPVVELTEAAEVIGKGQLDASLPLFGGRDELSRLSAALSRMVAHLKLEIQTRREAESHLKLAATVYENSREGILICDAENRIVSVNRAFSDITGFSTADVVGSNPRMLGSGRHPASYYQVLWSELKQNGHWEGEIWNRRKDGEVFPEWLAITAVRDTEGVLSHYVAVFTDITEHKEAEERIRFLASHDPLTGLPNRNLLNDRCEHALGRVARIGTRLALVLLDIDRFKDINDAYGHVTGDRLLREFADKLRGILRPGDTLARQGGDEFVMLVEDVRSSDDLGEVIEGVLEVFKAPIEADGCAITLTPSIGIALYPEDGADLDSLIKHADMAMYQAKELGRNNYQFYTPALNERITRRFDLESRLKNALAEGHFEVYYQPQVDVASGRIVGAEALLRLNDPERGVISPVDFIPLAEETGLILPIGEWVMETAIRQAASWAERGYSLRVAVNISAKQLGQSGLASQVARLLGQTGLAPDLLEIELTESVLMMASDVERGNLEQLIRLGLDLSLDDFGTGYSSLAYLRRLKVASLKIDRSFIHDLDNPEGAMLTEVIISMARGLGLRTVAEGIEEERQLEFLRRRGVDIYQGYYCAKPLRVADFEAKLVSGMAAPV